MCIRDRCCLLCRLYASSFPSCSKFLNIFSRSTGFLLRSVWYNMHISSRFFAVLKYHIWNLYGKINLGLTRQSCNSVLWYIIEAKQINFAKRLNSALSGIFAPRARKKLISRTPRYKAAENFDGIPGYLTINSICISLHFRLYYVNMSYIKQS